MRITRRGQALLATTGAALAFGAGMSWGWTWDSERGTYVWFEEVLKEEVVRGYDEAVPNIQKPETIVWPPCAEEDGSGGPLPCVWVGSMRGNGVGATYIVYEDGTVEYFD